MSSAVPDLAEVLAARRRIEPYLRPTPLYRYPALDETSDPGRFAGRNVALLA